MAPAFGRRRVFQPQTDVDELLELFLTSLTNALDPHTTYMAPQEQDDFNVHLKLELKGIGATLRPDDGSTVVETLVPGGAADLDGRIKIGDQIVAVAQDDGSSHSARLLGDLVGREAEFSAIVAAKSTGSWRTSAN